MLYLKDELFKFEQAISFLVESIHKHCDNEKPVIFHSLRVGFKLIDEKQEPEIVLAGFLHDLVEDSNVSISEIEKKFGKQVAQLVDVNTFDKIITNYKKRWKKAIARILAEGKPAMMIKIADNLDNLPYYWQISDKDTKKNVLWKHKYTIAQFIPKMQHNQLFQEYIELFTPLTQNIIPSPCHPQPKAKSR